MIYDYCIIGGGIAGLYCATKLATKYKVLLCEKYKYLGGRVSTYYGNKIQYEEGAGRISKEHTLVLELIKKYNLTLYPIKPELHYKKNGDSPITENEFEPSLDIFFGPLQNLSKDILQSNTLRSILEQIHGKQKTNDFLIRFPYRAEVDILRADIALDVFHHEMKSHEGYFLVSEGLSALIECMRKEFLELGGKIANHYTCININENEKGFTSEFISNNKKKVFIHSNKVICALPCEALKQIPYFKDLNVLKYVKMEPLLRTYANYPTHWFKGLGRIVTNTHIRYFLPMSNNLAMVSYTDTSDAEYYGNILKINGEKTLGKLIQNELKELFPEISIPNYTFFKSHYWKNGATYWLVDKYDVNKESMNSIKPFDSDIYIVGESFSLKQAWMEGALEQCKKFFDHYSK